MVGVHSTSKKGRKSTVKKNNTKKVGDEEGGTEDDPEDQEDRKEGWTARDHGPQLQDVNLMEYYETMRPDKPFNAIVLGQVVPIYMIKTYVDGAGSGDQSEP